MKQRILLLMMTALLSVGAWATDHLWDGEKTPNGWGFVLTESKSMSVGDILTFTITAEPTYGGITLYTIDTSAGYASQGTELKTIPAKLGKVVCVVDAAIAAAAADGLWLGGSNYTVTSVDYEKAVGVNLYTEAEGNVRNYWSMRLSSSNLLYAKTGDVLHVTISAVGNNENWRKLYLLDAEGNPDAEDHSYTGNILYTCENGNLKVGTIDIRLTDAMVSKAQEGNLHIGGFEYTFTAVDLYLTFPTVTINASAGYATFGYPAALDLTDIDAYTVTVSDGKAQLTSVKDKKIPAGTGIILEGSGDVTIPLTTEATDDVTGNELLVSDGTVTGDESTTIYVLANGASGVGFYKLGSGVTVPAGKAYLQTTTVGAPEFIGFGDGTTGIDEVRSNTEEVRSDYHDLQGRRVAQPTKGLYIVNGKKVIIK